MSKQNQSKKMAQIARRVLHNNQEVKYHCVEAQSQNASSTWTIVDLSQIVNGDGGDDRDGNQVRSKYLKLRGMLLNADSSNVVRVMLLRSYGTSPSASALPSGTGIGAPFGCWRNRQRGTFKILHDKLYSTNATNIVRVLDIFVKDSAGLNFGSASTAAAENNGYYLCYISDSTVSSHPTITYQSELAFTDS